MHRYHHRPQFGHIERFHYMLKITGNFNHNYIMPSTITQFTMGSWYSLVLHGTMVIYHHHHTPVPALVQLFNSGYPYV